MVSCRLVLFFHVWYLQGRQRDTIGGPFRFSACIPLCMCKALPPALPTNMKFTDSVQSESGQHKEVYHVCCLINCRGQCLLCFAGWGLVLKGNQHPLPPKKENGFPHPKKETGEPPSWIRRWRSWPPLPWSPRRLCWHSAP